MSVFTALYNLMIGPLELFFEIIFSLANQVIQNPGLTIIFLSIAINILVLPLYRQADSMQEAEREMEAKMHPWVSHIKKNFKGDERFMMLQTYYRQNNYKPTDALRGSVSLLLEIPFFMAAYNFLSSLQILQGVSFGPIRDLGAPDAMFMIGSFTVNVLPILMTAINIVSAIIYTKGFPAKAKVQLYGMAALFLILLYDSPAGLVFYWTLNNVFSLVKNIFCKLKNPRRAVSILSSLSGIALMAVVIFVHPMDSFRTQFLVLAFLLVLQVPAVSALVRRFTSARPAPEITKQDNKVFFLGAVFVTILTGILIPATVIKSSPEEFINTMTFTNPLMYVLHSFLIAAGTFLVWFTIFYMLAGNGGKKMMGLGMWVLSGLAVVNYMFFGTDYGTLSSKLKFDLRPAFEVSSQVTNLLVLLAVAAVLVLVWKKKEDLVRLVYTAAILAMVGMSAFSIHGIQQVVPQTIDRLTASGQSMASIPLSRTGKNVVVLMMDRAIGSYIPYLFNEKPELQQQFAGFTYYPNMTSFGGFTNIGTPPLFGGYEYTPEQMNLRDEELLEDKHNEALKVMPVTFRQQGYEVTVCDPSYAGYSWIPDLSVFDDYPEINTFLTAGRFDTFSEDAAGDFDEQLNRNFFCYSMFKIAPTFLQPTLYNDGLYNKSVAHVDMVQVAHDISTASGVNETFMRSFSVLKNLKTITHVTDEEQNTFMMMSNDSTHEPLLLQEPQYEPAAEVDNREYDAANADRFNVDSHPMKMETIEQMTHYHINMASMIQIGNWLDFLRENGVYDNTRIIIVSDHGRPLRQREDMLFGPDADHDVMFYNSLLMVKDFGAQEFTTDNTFMTTADVPTLSFNELVENPVNPFTNKPITSDPKFASDIHVLLSYDWDVSVNNGTTFLPGTWMSVHDDIFDMNNWKELDGN